MLPMHFTIQREAFLKPLRAVAGVVERRSQVVLPILSNVLMELRENQIFLTTTDQEVELNAYGDVESSGIPSGKMTVPLRKLMEICRALPEGSTITFKQEDQDKVSIRSGRSRFSLSSLPAEHFPSVSGNQPGISLQVSNSALKQLVDDISFAMAEQDVRYYLNGMLLEMKGEGLYGVAADGHRLALSVIKEVTSETKKPAFRLIVPRKGVLELQRILEANNELITLTLSQQHLSVTTPQIGFTSKLLEGKFPDYQRIIPAGGDKIVVGRRLLLKDAFLRAAALFNDKSRGVKLRLTSGCLNILAINADQDEVEEDLEVDYQGEDLEIGFNVKYLIDFLTVIPEDWIKLTFTNASNSARVEGMRDLNESDNGRNKKDSNNNHDGNQVYVIMPMRI